ncbi:hypothetical protein [endosymbiont 'TC1' of Trimyema compressum]|uniref:hypothetical protein n=1 Tax=endosymbiont 'TC1' of Trimyema compressum TaxID=243899 RepID=UPI00316AD5C7
MYELKTKESELPIKELLESIENHKKREDGYKLLKIYEETKGFEAKIWGTNMIGFGKFQYKYASGQKRRVFPNWICS